MDAEFQLAKIELGEKEFNKKYREIFGKPVLDFVETLVFNLPGPCYCDCPYCIDAGLRKRETSSWNWITVAQTMMREFPNIKHVTITGGTLLDHYFSTLVFRIKDKYPNAEITWNTNGIIPDNAKILSKLFDHVNLHVQSTNYEKNIEKFGFYSQFYTMKTIEEMKEIFGDRLALRTTITNDFDIDEFVQLGIPLFLNRQLPVTQSSHNNYLKVINKIHFNDKEKRRNNQYFDGTYKNVPVRIGVGDNTYEHIPNREPIYLNVAILHRSGIISGTWHEDDKVLYEP